MIGSNGISHLRKSAREYRSVATIKPIRNSHFSRPHLRKVSHLLSKSAQPPEPGVILPWRRLPDGNLYPSELGATRLYHFQEEKSWAIPNLKEVFPLVLAVQESARSIVYCFDFIGVDLTKSPRLSIERPSVMMV